MKLLKNKQGLIIGLGAIILALLLTMSCRPGLENDTGADAGHIVYIDVKASKFGFAEIYTLENKITGRKRMVISIPYFKPVSL